MTVMQTWNAMARVRRPAALALAALLVALGVGYAVDAARGSHPAPTSPVTTPAPRPSGSPLPP